MNILPNPVSARVAIASEYARGPVVVSVGAGVLGLFSYVFLTAAARGLDRVAFGELSTLWVIVFGFVAGLWYPFEQELIRVFASGRATATSEDVRRVGLIQGITLLAAEAGVAAYLLATADSPEAIATWLGASLMLALISLGASGYQRGRLLGRQRYAWAATQQIADGLARAVGAVACLILGLDVVWFGVVLGVAPLVGVIAALPGTPRRGEAVAASRSWGLLIRDLLSLLAGSYVAIVLLNVGPLVVRASSGAAAAGLFMAIFVVARLPIYFAGVAASGFLPRLVVANAQQESTEFSRLVRSAVVIVGVASVAACVVLGLLGPWLAVTFFGADYSVSLLTSLLLTLSSAGYVTALLLQAALVAAGNQRGVAWTWALGAVGFVLALLLPLETMTRVALAYLLSSIVVVAAMTMALGIHRRPARSVQTPPLEPPL